MNTEGPADPFTGGRIEELAFMTHELYVSFRSAGFNDSQAMTLTNTTLQTMITMGTMMAEEEEEDD